MENVENVAALNLPFGSINNPVEWELVRELSLSLMSERRGESTREQERERENLRKERERKSHRRQTISTLAVENRADPEWASE